MEREVKIKYQGQEKIVKVRRLTYGEERDSLRKAARNDGNVDMILRGELQLLMSIVEAPFQKTLDGLRSLDWEEGQKVADAFNELNKPNVAKKENSETESGIQATELRTQN